MASTSYRCLARSVRASGHAVFRRAAFHSYDHPSPAGLFTSTEERLLASAYKHVPSHGFSQQALGLGARDAGYLDISPNVLSDGTFSLVRYHLAIQRLRLATRERQTPDRSYGGSVAGDNVASITWERLIANREVIHQWSDALAIMAQPDYLLVSLEELAKLCDEILFLSGEKSVDSSWYTKRAALSTVYSTTELFMTRDTSPDFVDTKEFLLRRLDEIQAANGVFGSIGQWVGFTINAGINVARSRGIKI